MKADLGKLNKAFDFFDLPPKPLVGLEISSSSIKMVELSRKRNGQIALEGYVVESVPREAFNEQGIADVDALGASVERAWKRLGTKIKNVSLSLPSNAAITKKIHLAADLDEEQVADQVGMEANSFLPFPLEEVNLDWVYLGPYAQNPEESEYLVCAARKEILDDYIGACQAGGLKVIVADVENYAQQAAFEHLVNSSEGLDEQVLALVDAGSSTLRIFVYWRGASLFFKEIPFGANQLTESISHTYGLGQAEAEEAKRRGGAGLDNYESQALHPFLESMAMEINRALQFFLTQGTVERIDRIFLAGGCATFPGAASAVESLSGVRSEVINPFSGMDLSSRAKRSGALEAPMLMTACGLALRRFD